MKFALCNLAMEIPLKQHWNSNLCLTVQFKMIFSIGADEISINFTAIKAVLSQQWNFI